VPTTNATKPTKTSKDANFRLAYFERKKVNSHLNFFRRSWWRHSKILWSPLFVTSHQKINTKLSNLFRRFYTSLELSNSSQALSFGKLCNMFEPQLWLARALIKNSEIIQVLLKW